MIYVDWNDGNKYYENYCILRDSFLSPNHKYRHHLPPVTQKTVPNRQGPPTKQDPIPTLSNQGTTGGIRMSDEQEPHVYELNVPDDFELLKVIRIGEHTLQIELRGKNLRLIIKS